MLRAKQSQATSNKISAWLDSILAEPLAKIEPVVIADGNTSMYRKTEVRKPSLSLIRRRRARRGQLIGASTSFRTSWF